MQAATTTFIAAPKMLNRCPDAPKKVKKTVKVAVDIKPERLDFTECPGAPKKTKKALQLAADAQPTQLLFRDCPGAPKKVKKTRDVLVEVENLPPAADAAPAPAPFSPERAPTRERVCPGAPKKRVPTMARTPLAWLPLTDTDMIWY